MSLYPVGRIRVNVTGARGATFADIARSTGAFGSSSNDSDYNILNEKFANYAITQNAGFQSVIPGPAGPTFVTMDTFRAAPSSNKKQSLKINGVPFGDFYFDTSSPPYVDDGINVIKANDTALSVGAWLRQGVTYNPAQNILSFFDGKSKGGVFSFKPQLGDLIADCTDIGVGTDMSAAIASFIASRIASIGKSAQIILSEGRRRVATPQVIDLQGSTNLVIDLGTITPDQTAMTAFTFVNGRNITIRATILEGGPFAGYGASFPYYCDYSTTKEVVSQGGAECIKIAGIFGCILDVSAINYAGRAVRTTQKISSTHPDTGALKGRLYTTRSDSLSKPRVAQSIYADAGTNIGQGNWGELEIINDFDWYGPVWIELNDIRIKTFDCAYANNGPIFLGCESLEFGTVYIGDIDNNNQNNHMTFGVSSSGRICRFISWGTMRFLNKGNGLSATSADGLHGSIDYIAGTSAPFTSAFILVNCQNVDLFVKGENGSNIGYVQGSNTDNIRLRLNGKNFSSNAFFVIGGVSGKITLEGSLSGVPAGYSTFVIAGDSTNALVRFNLDLSSANGTLINVPSPNKAYWTGGSVTGNVWANANRPVYVNTNAISGSVPS